MALERRRFLLALAGSMAVHAGVLNWTGIEFASRPEIPPVTVIDVKLAVVQTAPVIAEEPARRKAVIRPLPRPVRVVPQATPRAESVPAEPIANQPLITQSAVENPAPRVAAPMPEAPLQTAVVPKARASEPDYTVRYLYNPPPQYPWQARRMGIEGRVVLHVEILQNGNAGRIEIRRSSGHELLDEAAIKAVGGWRFEPARNAGSPITTWADVPISFRLTDR